MGLGWASRGSPYTDSEELWGQQHDVGVIIHAGPMVSPPGKHVGFAHRLAGSVMEEEIESGEIE
jgi:hypothetical protein